MKLFGLSIITVVLIAVSCGKHSDPDDGAAAFVIASEVLHELSRTRTRNKDLISYSISPERFKELIYGRMSQTYPEGDKFWDRIYVHRSYIDDPEYLVEYFSPFLLVFEHGLSEQDSAYSLQIALDVYGERVSDLELSVSQIRSDYICVSDL